MPYIGQLREAAARLTPAQALYHLAGQSGVPVNKQFATAYDGIRFPETTGSGHRNGQLVRPDALAAQHRGHVLPVCVSGLSDAFATHEPLLQHVLHSLAPCQARCTWSGR